MDETKNFDLNIEKVLEDWKVYHGLREIIANAIDEKSLTNTQDIEIFKDDLGNYHIRDFGRGLTYQHLTQNENEEKNSNPDVVIGKFGVGLKDALATFERNGIDVLIKSKHGDITINKSTKHGFEDILTLHAIIKKPSDPNLEGTDVILTGITDYDIKQAQNFFLTYSNNKLLESTEYGEIYDNRGDRSKIYINGLLVATEENFLFSYNITKTNSKIRKALNRERTNVGRQAYTDRIKQILLKSKSEAVIDRLVNDIEEDECGYSHDEIKWVEISKHACTHLNSKKNVIFLTSEQIQNNFSTIDDARSEGIKVVTIPNTVANKIKDSKDFEGNTIRNLETYFEEKNSNYEYTFIDEKNLTDEEKEIFNKTEEIINLMGGRPSNLVHILISETLQKDIRGHEVCGLWNEKENRIIIRRDQLKNLETYSGVLLHELAHARSGADDVSRSFELELSSMLGIIAEKIIRNS
ncbi:hypothetical protein HNP88_000812 [Methanococcus maripaludis]|uniref:MPN635 N-terminal domain-containing protein n=1 Tax=Methanococcus maripaludis TaxID=39152 RepID=A0A7J9NPF5_METMI|nr:ATP-binding protein [Methanococcus maripaludis]MBA2846628.1 hypothetical protein [Methanococcus maripaludis]